MSRMAGGASVALLLVLLGCLLMLHPWSQSAEPAPPKKDDGGGFASDRFPKTDPAPFDARRAMGYLEAICKTPRVSGTPEMKKQQDLLAKHFKEHGGKLTWQRFKATQRSVGKPVEMANLVVSWHPERNRRVILCSHYDTRPVADEEPNPRRWREPFLSANDGGSGVALLMELAHHMKDLKTEVGVDFVLFDGEEYVYEKGRDVYFFGSSHFARHYRTRPGKTVYLGAVLLDMVGGKKARFPVEQNSWFAAQALVRQVWGIADELKCDAFSNKMSNFAVDDDHVPLNKAGIPAIDIIDFDGYKPHWHRLSDLPENCSGETLEQVARVVSVWVQRVE